MSSEQPYTRRPKAAAPASRSKPASGNLGFAAAALAVLVVAGAWLGRQAPPPPAAAVALPPALETSAPQPEVQEQRAGEPLPQDSERRRRTPLIGRLESTRKEASTIPARPQQPAKIAPFRAPEMGAFVPFGDPPKVQAARGVRNNLTRIDLPTGMAEGAGMGATVTACDAKKIARMSAARQGVRYADGAAQFAKTAAHYETSGAAWGWGPGGGGVAAYGGGAAAYGPGAAKYGPGAAAYAPSAAAYGGGAAAYGAGAAAYAPTAATYGQKADDGCPP